MTLAMLQRDFCAWLRHDDPVPAARLELTDPRGLAVYRNNYRGSLTACLAETLPHTLDWLGTDAFEAAATAYIDAHPPQDWTLDAYPQGFSAFLGELYPDDAEVAELAALEWCLSESFVAADCPALTPADMSGVDWDRAVLRLVPSASLLAFLSNAPAIWSALEAGETPPDAAIAGAPVPLLVWREAFTCCFRALEDAECELVPAMASGLGFAELCARLAGRLGQAEAIAMAGSLLARWAGEGLLQRIA